MAREVNCCSADSKRLVEQELEQEKQNTLWDYKWMLFSLVQIQRATLTPLHCFKPELQRRHFP